MRPSACMRRRRADALGAQRCLKRPCRWRLRRGLLLRRPVQGGDDRSRSFRSRVSRLARAVPAVAPAPLPQGPYNSLQVQQAFLQGKLCLESRVRLVGHVAFKPLMVRPQTGRVGPRLSPMPVPDAALPGSCDWSGPVQ
jgi:hypothetical protein